MQAAPETTLHCPAEPRPEPSAGSAPWAVRQPILTGRGLVKTYGRTAALAGVDIDIRPGEVLAIVGPSGSGKTSLLHVLAGILPADAGQVTLAGRRVDNLSERRRSELRRTRYGFVFQTGLLVDELSVEENAALPMLLGGISRDEALHTARAWLTQLGLSGMEQRRPGELSNGQAQRVAIARALAHRPAVIFADEPTGALDTRTGEVTMLALLSSARQTGAAIVVVTHDLDLARSLPRLVTLRDGRIVDDAGPGVAA